MAKGAIIKELKAARTTRGLTMAEAGAMVLIDGKGVDKATWHAWESGRKIPSYPYMCALEAQFGIEPNAFYERPRQPAPRPPADQGQLPL